MASAYDAIAGDYHPAQRGLTNRFSGEKITEAVSCFAEENFLLEPESGKQITLYWIALSSSESQPTESQAVVQLGEKIIYRWYLGAPGAFMHWEPIIGAVNAPLTLNLSGEPLVLANWTYTEDFPRNE